MIETTAIVAAAIGALASLVSGLYANYRRLLEIKKIAEEKELIKKDISEVSIDLGLVKFKKTFETEGAENIEPLEPLIERIEEQVVARVSKSPGMSKQDIKQEVKKELEEFSGRLENIENRFPEGSQLEKISSINDAILSERIEQLSKQLSALENKVLSRWDVAVTVSMIIGGVFTVVAATYGVINFITSSVGQ